MHAARFPETQVYICVTHWARLHLTEQCAQRTHKSYPGASRVFFLSNFGRKRTDSNHKQLVSVFANYVISIIHVTCDSHRYASLGFFYWSRNCNWMFFSSELNESNQYSFWHTICSRQEGSVTKMTSNEMFPSMLHELITFQMPTKP